MKSVEIEQPENAAPRREPPGTGRCLVCLERSVLHDSADVAASPPDLQQEGANIRRLAATQTGRETPLSFSSKGARAVLNQF